MLPAPTSTPTMHDNSNKTQRLPCHQKHQHQQKQEQQINLLYQPSSFYLNSSSKNVKSTLSSTISTNTLPTKPLNTSSFLKKTLSRLSPSNFSDYTTEYSSTVTPRDSTLDLSSFNSSSNSYATKTEVHDGLLDDQRPTSGTSGVAEKNTYAFDGYATAADMALSNSSHHLETTTPFPTAQTVATFIAGNKNRATTIIVYPTVSPESIVIPIVSCIFGFPILAFIVICCLRHRAKLARERDRLRNYDVPDHAVSLVRFSPLHRINCRSSRAISLRPERSLSQGFPSLELDTVVEERCSEIEQSQTDTMHAESPMESSTTSCKISFSNS